MRWTCCLMACLVSSATLGAEGFEDVRVELYSKTGVREVLLTADREPVQLREGRAGGIRTVVNPSHRARCASAKGTIQCEVDGTTRAFTRLSARSQSGVQLKVIANRAGSEGEAAAMLVPAVDVNLAGGHLRVLATMDLETYVQGVLAGEAATLKSPQALAAMAVLARTWALRSRGRHAPQGFDFCSLTHCQFFRPPSDALMKTLPIEKAVRETEKQVLEYRGELIDGYYSASCGGVTAAASDVWPGSGRPYLISVRDPYCAGDAQAAWTRVLPLKALSSHLEKQPDPPPGAVIHGLTVDSRDASGRARTLRWVGSRTGRIDANQFRFAVNRRFGWNTLKSSLFSVEQQGDTVVIRGRGLGHGVGLCQAGAEQMGRMGIGYERILAHYFPGTQIENAEPARSPRVLSSQHFDFFFPAREAPHVAKAVEILETERRRLGARAAALPARIKVRTFETTADFIRTSGEPGWVAATNDGRTIDLQPLSTLQTKGILASTLRHELTHLLVHQLRASGVPTWYEEGVVLYLTGEKVGDRSNELEPVGRTGRDPAKSKPQLDAERAYERARKRVAELARRRGEAALWQVLTKPSPEDLRWFQSPK